MSSDDFTVSSDDFTAGWLGDLGKPPQPIFFGFPAVGVFWVKEVKDGMGSGFLGFFG